MNPLQQETPEQAAERIYPPEGDYFNRSGVIAAYIQGREDERQAQNKSIGTFTAKDMMDFASHVKDEEVDGWELSQWQKCIQKP